MIEDTYNAYLKKASLIENWKLLNKNEVANLYIEHENDELRDCYFSVLMLKYWSKIYDYKKSSSNIGLDLDDFSTWLSESIMRALKSRAWKDERNKLYTDVFAPDKVINRCIQTTRDRFYQYSNYAKRKNDFNQLSIEAYDESHTNSDDSTLDYSTKRLDIQSFEEDISKFQIEDLIYSLAHKNVLQAIIINCLCLEISDLGDTTTTIIRRLANSLEGIDNAWQNSFSARYNISQEEVKNALDRLYMNDRRKFYRRLKEEMYKLKLVKEVKDYVAN